MNLIYLDTETTGLDPHLNDIIEVAGIIEIDGVKVDEFDLYVQPINYDSIQQSAIDAHHISVEQMRGFEPPSEVIKKLNAKLLSYSQHPYIIIGQNPKFDYLMLNHFWKKHESVAVRPFNFVFNYKTYDLTSVAALFHIAGIFNFGNFKLGSIIKEIGISFNGEAHNALVDTRATYEAWQWFIAYVKQFNPPSPLELDNLFVNQVKTVPIESPKLIPVTPVPNNVIPIPVSTVLSGKDFPGLFDSIKR
jgi:DNA polymerase III alpha subunit (gram-positive type)